MSSFIRIATTNEVISHTRFHLTLRSAEGTYHSLILFRLSTDAQDADDATAQMYVMESACPHLGADMSHADIEECEDGLVAVCPWHRYDFDLKTGKSDTGLKACTYAVEVRGQDVWIDTPEDGTGWALVEMRPVSEEFADPPPPDLTKLSMEEGKDQVKEDVIPASDPPTTLIQWAVLILNTPDPELKVQRTRHAVQIFRTGQLRSIGRGAGAPQPPDMPPRVESLKVLNPGKMAKRRNLIAMLHALANIEQWAIDLAWDIIARFGPTHRTLPLQFFTDFTKMALDESKHFSLLSALLSAHGTPYGSLPVHAGLWESAQRTFPSLRSRLAIIHLVHEARGLDVNPATIAKFRNAGPQHTKSVDALEIIHADEITHVTTGHRWFTFVCAEQGVEAVGAFREEVKAHFVGMLKGPFNETDRAKAGMTREFYEDLKGEAPDFEFEAGKGRAAVQVGYDQT